MNRKWIHVVMLSAVLLVLTACGQTVEEQVTTGIDNAEMVFNSDPTKSNKSIGHIELYLPKGYGIEKGIRCISPFPINLQIICISVRCQFKPNVCT